MYVNACNAKIFTVPNVGRPITEYQTAGMINAFLTSLGPTTTPHSLLTFRLPCRHYNHVGIEVFPSKKQTGS